MGRLTERRVLAPVIANPVLVNNTYDQATAGYYNTGKLTRSVSPARTETFTYNGNGFAATHYWIDPNVRAALSHVIPSADGSILARAWSKDLATSDYFWVGDTLNSGANYWKYDALGRLKSVPGIITVQTTGPPNG